MSRSTVAFIQLLSPILVGLLLLAVLVIAPTLQLELSIPALGPAVAIRVPLNNPATIRLVVLPFVLVSFAAPAFRNYAAFFPTYVQFRTYFDTAGIEKALHDFSLAEREDLSIDNGWREYRNMYLDKLNSLLNARQLQNPQYPFPPYVRFDETTTGSGEYAYSLTPARGWQNYQLQRASGYVRYQFNGQGGQSCQLLQIFELHPTRDVYVMASLVDIYFRYTKVLRPVMKQLVPTSPLSSAYVDDIVAATKVRFFPLPELRRTLYLVDRDRLSNQTEPDHTVGSGRMIPVAYGVYE